MNKLPQINAKSEADKITGFLKSIFSAQGIENAVLALSGGIDSAVVLGLLSKALPPQNITVLHLPYFMKNDKDIGAITKSQNIPDSSVQVVNIKPFTDSLAGKLGAKPDTSSGRIRFGNIAVRTRMIITYDFAKKNNGLVVGTENKSEKLLGYFTRFGDQASDIEPIEHLYKTQVYRLAEFLNLPQTVLDKAPSAGLWEGQTDEGEFGFSHKEADEVLYQYYDLHKPVEQITAMGYMNAAIIIDRLRNNEFKHNTPYSAED